MNMKKTKTTYGVYNLIEWYALLRLGKASVKVQFTGGSITTQGVTPATFTTEDPVIQFAIERSPEFINGKIKVVRRAVLNEVVEIERNVPKAVACVSGSDQEPIPSKCTADPAEEGDNIPDTQSGNVVKAEENSEPGVKCHTQVEFSCNDDAKDYLEQTFGLVRSKLRNREDIVSAGKANNVEIIFV